MPKHCLSDDVSEHENSLEAQTYHPSQNAKIVKLMLDSISNILKGKKSSTGKTQTTSFNPQWMGKS